jgi:site-specific recombinase XerD
MSTKTLAYLLHTFFYEWMGRKKNFSNNTVLSYRDTWKLLLSFVSNLKHKPITALSIQDIDDAEIEAFLQYLEDERKVSIGTRNCRLAAIHSFFAYVSRQEPLAVEQCKRIADVPVKKDVTPTMSYMEAEEIVAVLAQPDISSVEGQRDHALLAFLYNTGARIQEALNVCPKDIRFEAPAEVRLLGKGLKERVCPLWPETVGLLKALLQRTPRANDQPIFVNCYGQPLGARGVRFKLHQYVLAASADTQSLKEKRVTPHTFRHYMASKTMSARAVSASPIAQVFGPSMSMAGSGYAT